MIIFMNKPITMPIVFIVALVAAFLSPSPDALGAPDAGREKVKELYSQSDWASIAKLIDTEEELYKSAPTVSNFNDLYTVTQQLFSDDTRPQSIPYWLYRKAAWKAILAPLPIMHDPMDPRVVLDQKRGIIDAVLVSSMVWRGQLDVDRRHDSAMLLMSYASWLKHYIVPEYKEKPVAPINANPDVRDSTKQNDVDNNTQQELHRALGELSIRYYNDIMALYSKKPRNDEEARELVDSIEMADIRRQVALREFSKKP